MSTKNYIFSCCVLLLGLNSWSQNTFMKTLGTESSDYGTTCIPTNDYGTLVVTGGGAPGSTNVQFGLAKATYDGTLEWGKVFSKGSFSLAYDAVATDDGYCVLGSAGDSFNDQSLFLLKTDALGNELWAKSYPLASNNKPVQLIACKDGGFLSASIINYNSGAYPEALLIRFDDQGNILWSRTYAAFYGLSPRALVELSDGSFACVSLANVVNLTYPEHALVIRTDATGVPLWSKVFHTSYMEEPFDLVVNTEDELYIAGQAYGLNSAWDGFLLKLDADGNQMFSNLYDAGTSNGEIFRRAALNAQGNVLLLGDLGAFEERNIAMMEVDVADGKIQWANQYPLSPQFTNYPADLYLSYEGGIVLTGDVRPPGYVRDAALFRTDAQGMIACYTSPVNFTQSSVSFNEFQAMITSTELTVDSPEALTFSHPVAPISAKTICANTGPLTAFSFETEVACPTVCVDFKDESLGDPTAWYWEFEGANPSVSYVQNPEQICYSVSGTYEVRLVATNAQGTTSHSQFIYIEDPACPPGEIPNVFTPNGDNKNELFIIEGLSGEFRVSIRNRWGELMFETAEKNHFWDGRSKQGLPAQEGVYFYQIETATEVKHGFLHLVR